MRENKERNKLILEMRKDGKTLEEIAKIFRLTRQRVYHILKEKDSNVDNTVDKK